MVTQWLARGMTTPLRQMTEAANKAEIPYTLSASGRYTGTDADAGDYLQD